MGAKISKCCKKSWRMSNPVVVESQPVTVPPWSDAKDKSTQTTRPVAKEAAVVSRWRVLVRTMLLRLHVTTVADAAKAASEAATALGLDPGELRLHRASRARIPLGSHRRRTIEVTQAADPKDAIISSKL